MKDHDVIIAELTTTLSPTLCDAFGIGPDTALENLIVFGDNPDCVHSEAGFAKLCGVAPMPESSGMTTRHRLAWSGHRRDLSHGHCWHAAPPADQGLSGQAQR